MIVSSCPLRVSLFGGSTDNPAFIEKYGYGSVISFACDLKTYVSISRDKFGANNYKNKYVLNYSKREEVDSAQEIKNEIIKLVVDYFRLPPISIFLTSDVYSHGSGLASSSSYLIALIKAASMITKQDMSEHEICSLALQLEQKLNPHCGYQDPYGCGVGGFKRMEFFSDGIVKQTALPMDMFQNYDAHLIFTGVTRNSREVLSSVTDNIESAYPLLEITNEAFDAIRNKNFELVFKKMQEGWEQKKKSSVMITENERIKIMDDELNKNSTVISHKLCGAGNGGFFLTFSEKNSLRLPSEYSNQNVKINVSPGGAEGRLI